MVGEAPGDEAGLEALRQAGRRWPDEAHATSAHTGLTSELVLRSEHTGSHPGDTYVRFERRGKGAFRPAGPGTLRATAAVPRAQEPLGRVAVTVKEKVVGEPLATERAGHERLTKVAVAQLARCLPAEDTGPRHSALVSVDKLDLARLEALTYACSLVTGRVFGVHVAADEHPELARREWEAWGNHLPLVTIDAPYRAIVPPLRAYIDALDRADGGEMITLVLPLVFASGMLGRILHNHTAHRLRRLLLKRPNTVVVSVPHHLP